MTGWFIFYLLVATSNSAWSIETTDMWDGSSDEPASDLQRWLPHTSEELRLVVEFDPVPEFDADFIEDAFSVTITHSVCAR